MDITTHGLYDHSSDVLMHRPNLDPDDWRVQALLLEGLVSSIVVEASTANWKIAYDLSKSLEKHNHPGFARRMYAVNITARAYSELTRDTPVNHRDFTSGLRMMGLTHSSTDILVSFGVDSIKKLVNLDKVELEGLGISVPEIQKTSAKLRDWYDLDFGSKQVILNAEALLAKSPPPEKKKSGKPSRVLKAACFDRFLEFDLDDWRVQELLFHGYIERLHICGLSEKDPKKARQLLDSLATSNDVEFAAKVEALGLDPSSFYALVMNRGKEAIPKWWCDHDSDSFELLQDSGIITMFDLAKRSRKGLLKLGIPPKELKKIEATLKYETCLQLGMRTVIKSAASLIAQARQNPTV